jgi:hypothetical protein
MKKLRKKRHQSVLTGPIPLPTSAFVGRQVPLPSQAPNTAVSSRLR